MIAVQKYGGTSVGTTDKIKRIASRVWKASQAGDRLVVVVSAMAGETNRLLGLARQVGRREQDREVDALVSTGEQVTSALLALAIQEIGGKARSFTAHQVRITTDASYGRARISVVETERIVASLDEGEVAVVAGFQGVDAAGNTTTLGRGGSDTSAVALAAALGANVCEIYTDVDGIYTSDPNVVPNARKIDRISYQEMLDLSSLGAKVLQLRSVEFGMKYQVPIHVRSSFHEAEGTWVVKAEKQMEHVVVAGVTMTTNEAKVTVNGLSNETGAAYKFFAPLSKAGVVVDMIVKNESREGLTDISFTVSKDDRDQAVDILLNTIGHETTTSISSDDKITKVSVVGLGMRSHSGVATKMFEILANEGITIQLITTSEINISVVIDQKYGELATRALHDGFGLHLPAEEREQL